MKIFVFKHPDYNWTIGVVAEDDKKAEDIINTNYEEHKGLFYLDYDYEFKEKEGVLFDLENS